MVLFGQRQTVTFNLEKDVEFLSSKESSGIQMSDLVAGSICWAFKNSTDPFSQNILQRCTEADGDGIFPDPSYLDLNLEKSFVGSSILNELVQRTLHGDNLTADMDEFIETARLLFPLWLREQRSA